MKSDENKKIFHMDAINFYGRALSESSPYDGTRFDKNVKLEDIPNTPDDPSIKYFFEFDLKFSDNLRDNTKVFLFALRVRNWSSGWIYWLYEWDEIKWLRTKWKVNMWLAL